MEKALIIIGIAIALPLLATAAALFIEVIKNPGEGL